MEKQTLVIEERRSMEQCSQIDKDEKLIPLESGLGFLVSIIDHD